MTRLTFIFIHCTEYLVDTCNGGNYVFQFLKTVLNYFIDAFPPLILFLFFWKSIIQILGLLDEYTNLLNFFLSFLIFLSLYFASWELFSFTFQHYIAVLCWATPQMKQKKKSVILILSIFKIIFFTWDLCINLKIFY